MSEIKIRGKVEMWDIERLIPYEKNAKIHTEEQVAAIANSIKRFGWVGNPILADTHDVIAAGHGRRLAGLLLGLKQVPVVVLSDLSANEVRALRLAENRVALGEFDTNLLQDEIRNIDFSFEGIFSNKELDFLTARDLGEINIDAFAADLDEEVREQSAKTMEKIKEADEKPVKITQALGFDKIQGKDERLVSRFMARLEAEAGVTGADAFIRFVRNYITPALEEVKQ